MAIVLRADTGSALSHNQVDTNFTSFFYSASLVGNAITFFRTGSSALAIPAASASITLPGGTVWTASAADISRNSAVVITGSFRQGSAGLTATGENAHAEGSATFASGWHSHAEGRQTQARGSGSHAEGYLTVATGSYSHAEGVASQAKGIYSHAEGNACIAEGTSAHAEGASTDARAEASHTEGVSTIVDTTGYGAHAEGFNTYASGLYSHAEGSGTQATGVTSHAEGSNTQATGEGAHAEGSNTISSGFHSHSEGADTVAQGDYSHAEGLLTQAIGEGSHAEGLGTVALGSYQHAQGQFNISSSAQSAFIIGNGTEVGSRRNLVFASGSQFQVSGSLNVSGAINTVGNLTVQGNITAQQYIVSTSVYYVTESFSSGSHIFGNSADDTHQFTGSIIASPNIILPGSSSIFFGGNTLLSTSNFAIYRDLSNRLAIGNNISGGGYGVDGIKIDAEGKTQLNHISQDYGIYDTTLNIIGSGSNDGITMMQFPDVLNRYRISIQSGSQSKMNFANTLNPASGSFDFSGSVAVSRNITAGINVIAGSTVQGATVQPTTALILDGFGNNGMKLSSSLANIFVKEGFTIGSGSFSTPNSTEYIRVNSGGLTINNGFDLFVNGNKQYNYGAFYDTGSHTLTSGTPYTQSLSSTYEASGVSITGAANTRITVANSGTYNISFSTQTQQATADRVVDVWFKKNGTALPNSNTKASTRNGDYEVFAWNFVTTLAAGDYVELLYQSNGTNTTIPYIAQSGEVPATPSAILTVQQVR